MSARHSRILVFALIGAPLWIGGCVHYQDRPISPAAIAGAFERRSLVDDGLRDFLRRNAIIADTSPWPVQSWDYETLSWAAFYYHPSLELARAQWTTLTAGQVTAGSRSNPTLTLTPGYNVSSGSSSPWFPAVGIDLPVETAGKRQHRINQAQRAAESARQIVFSAAWQVRSELRRTVATWTHAEARAVALNVLAEADQRIVELVESRRAAGAASSLDAASARLAWRRSEADAADSLQQATIALSNVAQALGLPASAVSNLTVTDVLPRLSLPSDAEFAAARSLALRQRPDLLAALADYEVTQHALRLEIARQYPNLHLGPGYQWDQGASKWSLAITAELPLFNRNDGPIAEAEARRKESAAHFAALQAQVMSGIDRAKFALAAAEARTKSIQRIVASLTHQQAIQQARLDAGDIDQLDFQITRRELSAARLTEIDARAVADQAAAELEAALQVPFGRLSNLIEASVTSVSFP